MKREYTNIQNIPYLFEGFKKKVKTHKKILAFGLIATSFIIPDLQIGIMSGLAILNTAMFIKIKEKAMDKIRNKYWLWRK